MFVCLVVADIVAGRGCCLIDPHGELAEELLDHIPRSRLKDVIYFDATDSSYVPCFNPFEIKPEDDAGKIADDYVACFAESIMTGGTGPRMIHIFRNAIYALLRTPGTAFADISTLLSRTDEGQVLRDRVLQHIENPEAVKFAASLDAIVKHYKEDQREKFIEHIFYTFVDPMNYEDQIELMQQYLERFGAFLPPEEQTRSAIDLAREWQTLIRTHAEVIGNIQESLRRFS